MTTDTRNEHRAIQPLKSLQASSATSPPDPGYSDLFIAPRAAAGVPVTQQTALTYAAVFAAIRAISEDIAGLGHKTRRTNQDGTREDLLNHPATKIYSFPNEEISGYTIRESMQAHALSWGNGYSEIERNARRQPVALYLITPDRVTPRRIEGRIWYQVRNGAGNADTYLAQDNMLHLHGLGYDGLTGYSVIHMAARTIGMGIAGDEYGAATYNNRATPSGVLEHPSTLDQEGRDNLRRSWEHLYKGPQNSARVAILEEGMKFATVGLPPQDVQFIENRSFQIEEIARWYRIPPHKLAHIVKATFNNIEEQNINYAQDALLPWVNRWESESDRKLLAPGERATTHVKFNMNTLLRGAIEKRTESYVKGRQWGWLSANDVRTKEDMDPLPADIGDVYLSPMNMVPADQLGKEPPEPEQDPNADPDNTLESGTENDDRVPAAHLRPIIVDALKRCLNREINHAHRAPKTVGTEQEFNAWSANFYAKYNDYCVDVLSPSCQAAAVQAIGKVPAAMTTVLAVFVEEMIADTRPLIQTAWGGQSLEGISITDQADWLADTLMEKIAELITLS